jgi:hypothetical protein
MSNTPRTQKRTNHLPDSTQNNTRTPKRPITGSVALPAEAREKSVQLWHTACKIFNRTKNVAMPLILRWRGAHIARAEPSEWLDGAACSSRARRAVLSWSDFRQLEQTTHVQWQTPPHLRFIIIGAQLLSPYSTHFHSAVPHATGAAKCRYKKRGARRPSRKGRAGRGVQIVSCASLTARCGTSWARRRP